MIVSVMQWNVHSAEDLRRTSRFLTSNSADIICLQELTIGRPEEDYRHGPKYIAQQLSYESAFVELRNKLSDGRIAVIANAILTRFQILTERSAMINRPIDRGGFDDQNRAYLETVLDLGPSKLTVGTTHMSYTNEFEITDRKREETDRLLSVIGHRRHNFVLAGDLNAMPESYTIRRLSSILNHVGPDMSCATWTTKPFSYEGFEADSLNWRLDYLFASPNISVISSKILKTEYSDHLPVLGLLDVK